MNRRHRSAIASLLSTALALLPYAGIPADAQTASSAPRPQIVIAIGNSQSMDGDLSGAIMTGSGQLSSGLSSLYNSSSPVNYSVPVGFTPPMTPTDTASAPYTVNNGGTLYDNSASRLNVAKAGIESVLTQYLPSMDFALEDYSTYGVTKYTTWVYYMSPSGGFTFAKALPTNGFISYPDYEAFLAGNPGASPAPTRWVINPCYQYGSASSLVNQYCGDIDAAGIYSGSVASYKYMKITASSDDPDINDVLYSDPNYSAPIYISFSGPHPSSPYPPIFSLSNYESGGISIAYYNNTAAYDQYNPMSSYGSTSPTNAGYVPYSKQVMTVERGFGYGAGTNSNVGKNVVPMTMLASNPTAPQVSQALKGFTKYLNPESNSTGSIEIKALAGQSPLAGLVNGAGSAFGTAAASCAGQYVILVTDGLPTMDLNGYNWPPLGSASGQGYGVYAAFYGIPGSSNYGILDDSGNVPSGQTLGALDTSNTNDQALIDTITAIQNLAKKGIKTYVVGLGAGVDSTANPAAYRALNAMAIAGGTGQEYPANSVATFDAELNSIAAQIFSSAAIVAPVAPTSIQGGSLIYTATSDNASGSIAGHIQAYNTVPAPSSSASAPVGTATGAAIWDAGDLTHMPAAARQAALYSTSAAATGSPPPGSGSVVSLAAMGNSSGGNYDPAAFGLTANTCVPNIPTELAYTFDPSFNTAGDAASISGLGFPSGVSGCSYLAGRKLNWMLGGLSSNDDVRYLGPPGSVSLLGLGGYVQFAKNNSGREKLVLFTSNDGFLYAVDAATGNLVWGWMPRPFVSDLQNYTSFEAQQHFDGQFTVTDAANTATSPAAANWASYVVGTAEGGAYHYALRLSSNGSSGSSSPPSPQGQAQTWGIAVAGGSSPQMQAPIVVTVGGMQYAVFVVNTTTGSGSSAVTTSKLYEVNVATGLPASGAALSAGLSLGSGVYVTSALTYVSSTGTLYFGDNGGGVWSLNISGSAANDVGGAVQMATTNPAVAINYVGYTEISGLPYLWAATQSEITTFALSGGTSQSLWASSPTSGYKADGSGTLQAVGSDVVMPLQSGGEVSAAPVVVNGVLIVPVYVPPSDESCGSGNGYYDLFDLLTGSKPKITITYKNNAVTNGVISLGAGKALSPAVYVTGSGAVVYPGSSGAGGGGGSGGSPGDSVSPILFGGSVMNKPISWRQY